MDFIWVVVIFLGFQLLQSIYGFGGITIAIAVLALLGVDVYLLLLMGLMVSLVMNLVIFVTSKPSFEPQKLLEICLISLPFSLFGAFLIDYLDPKLLLKLFAVLILISLFYSFFRSHVSRYTRYFLVSCAGVAMGVTGTGGPILAVALKDYIREKYEFRSTLITYLLLLNFIKFVQLFHIQHTFTYAQLWEIAWIAIPVALISLLGSKIHRLISQESFQIGASTLLVFCAVALLLK